MGYVHCLQHTPHRAANFFHLLVAASKEQLEVSQKESYGDILVSVM